MSNDPSSANVKGMSESASAPAPSALIVDDEHDIRELLVLTLSRMGVDADSASTFREAQQALKDRPYDLCLTDMRLPDGDGLMVLRHIAEHHGNTPVAVITAFGSTENAVAALKAGAFDYLAKPIKLEQLRPLVISALKLPKPAQSRRVASGETQPGTPRLLGESPAIQRASSGPSAWPEYSSNETMCAATLISSP